MLVRTGFAADRLAGGEHPAAADLARLVGADREQLAARGPESRSLKASSSPEIPVSVPGGKPFSASSLRLRPAAGRRPRRRRRSPSAPTLRAAAGPSASGVRSAARIARPLRRPGAAAEPLAGGEPRIDQVRAPRRSGRRRSAARRSPASSPKMLVCIRTGTIATSPSSVTSPALTSAIVAVLAAFVVGAPGTARSEKRSRASGVSSSYIASRSSRFQASSEALGRGRVRTRRRPPPRRRRRKLRPRPGVAARVVMRRRRSAAEPLVLNRLPGPCVSVSGPARSHLRPYVHAEKVVPRRVRDSP